MWQDIVSLYSYYNNKKTAYICGSGESLIEFSKIKILPDSLVIAINFSIIITNSKTDLLFIDRLDTLKKIDDKLNIEDMKSLRIIMPIWSSNKFNFDNDICVKYKENLYYYQWSYLNERLLSLSSNYVLDKIQLYIGWGTSNSVIHFVSRLKKIKKIYLYGCKGNKENYIDYNEWQNISHRELKKRNKQHRATRKYQDIILTKLKMNYEYI